MPIPIQNKYSVPSQRVFSPLATGPTTNAAAGQVIGPYYKGPAAQEYWRDELGNEHSNQLQIREFAATRAIDSDDCHHLLVYTGTGAASVTLPLNATVEFQVGTQVWLLKGAGSGTLTLSDAAAAIVGPIDAGSYELRDNEEVRLVKTAADSWRLFIGWHRAIEVVHYAFRTKTSMTTDLGATAVANYAIPAATFSGNVATSLNTNTSGGLFCVPGDGNAIKGAEGNYVNAVAIRRSLDGSADAGAAIAFTDANGVERPVFALQNCDAGANDGDALAGVNPRLVFVYENASGVLTPVSVNADIEYQLAVAVASEDRPLEI